MRNLRWLNPSVPIACALSSASDRSATSHGASFFVENDSPDLIECLDGASAVATPGRVPYSVENTKFMPGYQSPPASDVPRI